MPRDFTNRKSNFLGLCKHLGEAAGEFWKRNPKKNHGFLGLFKFGKWSVQGILDHIPTLHELLAVLMLVRLETCWFHMRWAKLDGILHLEMLPICGSFKNVLSSEGETLKDCTLSCSALFSFPCLLFMPLFPSCSAVCRQPGCMLKKASPSVAWKQNFNFCCYKTQLWFPQLGIQYWCNWSEKVPVIWCDMKLFTSSLHIPSNLIKIFFFYFEKREKYFELCSSLVFPVELSCDKMFIQKFKDVKAASF